MPSAQNNSYAKVEYFRIAYPDPPSHALGNLLVFEQWNVMMKVFWYG